MQRCEMEASLLQDQDQDENEGQDKYPAYAVWALTEWIQWFQDRAILRR